MRRALCLLALVACAPASAPKAAPAAPVAVVARAVEPTAPPAPDPVFAGDQPPEPPPPPDEPPPPPPPEPTKAALGVALVPGRYLVDGLAFVYQRQNVCGMRTEGCTCTVVHKVDIKGSSFTIIGEGQSSVEAGHRFTVRKDAIVVRRK